MKIDNKNTIKKIKCSIKLLLLSSTVSIFFAFLQPVFFFKSISFGCIQLLLALIIYQKLQYIEFDSVRKTLILKGATSLRGIIRIQEMTIIQHEFKGKTLIIWTNNIKKNTITKVRFNLSYMDALDLMIVESELMRYISDQHF